MWAVVMSKKTSFPTQSWKTDSSFPKEWISEKWGEDYDISSTPFDLPSGNKIGTYSANPGFAVTLQSEYDDTGIQKLLRNQRVPGTRI